jgi:hypothetical protein
MANQPGRIKSCLFLAACGFVGLVWAVTPCLASECSSQFIFTPPQTVVRGSTRKEEICTVSYGRLSDITGYRVIQKPSHGTIGSAGREGEHFLTAYKPSSGYVGSDDFAASINYTIRSTGVSRSTIVRVYINVLLDETLKPGLDNYDTRTRTRVAPGVGGNVVDGVCGYRARIDQNIS